jgi:pilus assembly protein CpaB
MRRRLVTVLLFAVLAAFAASSVVYRAIAARTRVPKVPTATVVVAARDLRVGDLVGESDLSTVEWPARIAPSWVGRRNEIVGRGVVFPINEGEPIAENRLAPRGAGAGLAATIPEGMRAVAVKVDEVVGVSGFVQPGMRVDVLSSGTPPGGSGVVTRTILQHVEVLSAGRNLDRDLQGKPSPVQVVNLLVTPEQAEALSLASSQTRIQLVLRNLLDTSARDTRGISLNQLLSGSPAEPQIARAAKPRAVVAVPALPHIAPAALSPAPKAATVDPLPTVEVINGQKREVVPVQKAGEPESEQ